MSHRTEVFQSKVLQKLYPAAPKLEKEPSPPHVVEALAKNTFVKRNASGDESAAGQPRSAAAAGARMYTVLPAPADFRKHSEESVTLPQLEGTNSAKDPAEESTHESNEELDRDEEQEERRRKKRRRKRTPALLQDSGRACAAPGSESSTGVGAVEAGERLSRNKKRKLKKKRQKEKLRSMGVTPRAAALVFTYQKDVEKLAEDEREAEEEDDDEKRAAELSDFLRTTLEIYMSDSRLHQDKPPPLLPGTVEVLLSRISSGPEPSPVLGELCGLKAFVRQEDTERLEEALRELSGCPSMSAEETAAVVALFQYWITDILPMRGDQETRLSTAHP